MKATSIHRNIVIILLMVLPFIGMGQGTRYLPWNSTHALSVPENQNYHFHWTKEKKASTDPVESIATEPQYENVTVGIYWTQGSYEVTVHPEDTTTHCLGEPIKMTIKVVDKLSLHAFDDTYSTPKNTAVDGDLSVNDFDDRGAALYYTYTPIVAPKKGTVIIDPLGGFIYTPSRDSIGIDQFVYEVCTHKTNGDIEMCASALVTIVIGSDGGNADILVEKKGPTKALFGKEIEYSLVVRNLGPDDAKDVMVRDTLAFGLLDNNVRYSLNNTNEQPWMGELNIGNLAAGDSSVVTIFVTISTHSPRYIWNQALVYSNNDDPNPLNNDSIWMTEVSNIYVDASDLLVPSCQTATLYGENSNSLNPVTSYLWTPSDFLDKPTTANPTFTPGVTTKYLLTIRDSEGYSDTASITVTVPIAPKINMADTVFMDKNVPFKLDATKSEGDSLSFTWTTNDGKVAYPTQPKVWNKDTLTVAQPGSYLLTIKDDYGCSQKDTILVLYKSHPPVVVADTLLVTAQSATESPKDSINVLANDSDVNDFELRLDSVSPSPTFASKATFSYSEDGFIVVTPRMQYNVWDSLQYTVCNNGIPEQCNTSWLHVYFERPPLNADVQVKKSVSTPYSASNGDPICFWGDTIVYNFTILSVGPDTATTVTITDAIDKFLTDVKYSVDNGVTWDWWNGSHTFNGSLLPNQTVYRMQIKAFVNPNADTLVSNTAWIQHDIKENDTKNDTSTIVAKIKTKVVAHAGDDVFLGGCQTEGVYFDGSKSTGDYLTYKWSPATYLSNANSKIPLFKPTIDNVTLTYVLTVSDGDGITSTDTLKVFVLSPPVAEAGSDIYLRKETNGDFEIGVLDGRGSSGLNLDFKWSTSNGNLISDINDTMAYVDALGVYQLKVSDKAGCFDTSTVNVYQFFQDPFGVPDVYSVKLNGKLNDQNVLDNDYDVNHAGFVLRVIPMIIPVTKLGGRVNVNDDGSFVYDAPNKAGVDEFYYTVCNNADPNRCSKVKVSITVATTTPNADLAVVKTVDLNQQFAGSPITYTIEVTNHGPDVAIRPVITDSLSVYLKDATYIDPNGQKKTWPANGRIQLSGNIAVGQTLKYEITGTVKSDKPDRIYNAVSVASETFDSYTKDNGDGMIHRNVDTISFKVVSDLAPVVELIETYGDRFDATIGGCVSSDPSVYAYLDASKSQANDGNIDRYSWSNSSLLDLKDPIKPIIKPIQSGVDIYDGKSSDTIKFVLTIEKNVPGESPRIARASVSVIIVRPPFIDLGPDRKLNPGVPLEIDATNSVAYNGRYTWETADGGSYSTTANSLIINALQSGIYKLTVIDEYKCSAYDEVQVTENDLVVRNDIAIVFQDNTFDGNVATNDYDPDGDSLLYTGWVTPPANGYLSKVPETEPRHGKSVVGDRFIWNNGNYTYQPKIGFVGNDYFEYGVCDNNDPSLCRTGRVYIRVIGIAENMNNPPVATLDEFFMMRNDTLTEYLLNNDFDFDGGQITVETTPVISPTQGTVKIFADGHFEYISSPTATGSDRFVYRICDNGQPSACDTASVIINFHKLVNVNHPPVANNDAYYLVGTSVKGNVLVNDYDPDGDQISLDMKLVKTPIWGSFVLKANGDFEYTPNGGFYGTDQVVYRIVDDNLDRKEAFATVYIVSIDEKKMYSDVSMTKTAPAKLLSGSQIEYILTAKVEGPSLANNIVISDPMFDQLTQKQVSLDQGVTWQNWNGSSSLAQGLLYKEFTILLRGVFPDVFSDTIVNLASVSHNMIEPLPSNNKDSVQTIVYQKVIARLVKDTLIGACATDFKLDATQSLGMSTLSYRWSPPNLVSSPTAGATAIKTVEPESVTDYTVIVSSQYGEFNDADTASIRVTVGEALVASAGPDLFPETEAPVLLDGSASIGRQPLLYKWWQYDKKTGTVSEIANSETVSVNRSGDYYLTVTDPLGCEATDSMYLGYPVDEFRAIRDEVTTWQEEAVNVNVLLNDIIDPDDEYDYSSLFRIVDGVHGHAVPSGDSTFLYTPDPYFSGIDSFQYVVGTRYQPQSTAWVIVHVKERKPEIPGGFSPNGDGINDYLVIPYIDLYPGSKLIVFNRWGSVVYKNDNYQNDVPWDGVATEGIRIGHGPLPAGGYLYILDLGEHEYIQERYIKGVLYIASGK